MTVCSSSNADSIAGGSNDEEIYTDELVKDEGGSELVLALSREIRVIEWHGGIIIGLRYRNYVVLLSSRAVTMCMRK